MNNNRTGLFTRLMHQPQNLSPKRDLNKFESLFQKLDAAGAKFSIVGEPQGRAKGNGHYLATLCHDCGNIEDYQYIDIKKYLKINCKVCFNKKLTNEALQFNLRLLGDSTDGNKARRHYEFIACGHKRDIATADVRIGSISCTECREEQLFHICKEKRMTLLDFDHEKNKEFGYEVGQYRYVQYDDCGHKKFINRMHLINDNFSCKECAEDKIIDLAKARNLTYAGYAGKTRRKFIINSCGHDVVVGLTNFKNNNFRCKTCIIEKWKTEANDAGLVYLGEISGKIKRYMTPCGHEIANKPAHIRAGHWSCRVCESSFRDYPNNIYLFEMHYEDRSWLKLGFSKSPMNRKTDFRLIPGVITTLVATLPTKTGAFAESEEQRLHKKYKKLKINKEEMKTFFLESGYNECYPIHMKDVLLDELKSIKEKDDNT